MSALQIGTTQLWLAIGAYIFLSAVFIARAPSWIAPHKTGLTNAEDVEAIDLQNKVRQTAIQICGAIGALFSVFIALNAQDTSSKDIKAKYDRETAELFVKAVESKSPEALYALAYVARRDPDNYHSVVFRMLTSLVRTLSPAKCKEDSSNKTEAATKISVALQLLHERAVANDKDSTIYNIEYACLDDSDLSVQRSQWGNYRGMGGVRASGSSMLRIDWTRAELQNAHFMGVSAGDWRTPGWKDDPRRYELQALDDGGNTKYRAERRKYIAHFIDANLTNANFGGAGLEGADFSGAVLKNTVFDGANISRTAFRGAQQLTAEQFRWTCAGSNNEPGSNERDQPVFDEPLRGQIRQLGGIKPC